MPRRRLQRLPYQFARWISGDEQDMAAIRIPSTSRELRDEDGRVVLFESRGCCMLRTRMNPKLTFTDTRPSGPRRRT